MVKPVENYLYFALTGTAGDVADDAVCYPASTFIGATWNHATKTILKFEDNTANTIDGADTKKFNTVTLTHENVSTRKTIHMDIVKAIAKIMANPGKGKVLTVVDTADGVVAEEFEGLNNTTAISCATAFGITAG
tara:strand:- start:2672 stop:3076 length:405 start_codon:yes stop_codon:yes gene_type:complete